MMYLKCMHINITSSFSAYESWSYATPTKTRNDYNSDLVPLFTTTTILPLFAFVNMYSCAASAVARESKTRSTFTWNRQ